MALVLVTALFVGTVSQTGPTPTNADRLTAIARTIKCPVCSGESVAESNAEISQEIRKDIGQADRGGPDRRPDPRGLPRPSTATYILLTPSATGVTSLVWILPVVLLVVALAGLVVAFSRWRVRGEVHATEADRELVAPTRARAGSRAPATRRPTGAGRGGPETVTRAMTAAGRPTVSSNPTSWPPSRSSGSSCCARCATSRPSTTPATSTTTTTTS